MADLRSQLDSCFRGRVGVVGVGNVALGDDAAGVRLAERVRGPGTDEALGGARCILLAGTEPERCLTRLLDGGFDHILFLDAVDFGAAPGSVVWLDAEEIVARFPQVSTHKIALGALARCLAANGRARVSLLGIQPASCRPGTSLSPAVQRSVDLVAGIMAEVREDATPAPRTSPGMRGKGFDRAVRRGLADGVPLRQGEEAPC